MAKEKGNANSELRDALNATSATTETPPETTETGEATSTANANTLTDDIVREPQPVKDVSNLPEVGSKAFIYNPTERPLRDPHAGDYFPNGRTVRVKELGAWTRVQLEAGLLRVGKAEDVGADPADNSDYLADNPGTGAEEQ